MNLRKSIKIALAQKEQNATWLAGELKVSKQHISKIMSGANVSSKTIENVSKAFGLSASELIALGEEQ